MPFAFTVSGTLPATPRQVYDAWLDGKAHGAMTGAAATASKRVGGKFTAWDDYITGKNLILEPGKRIVQSWRTTQFTDKDSDSRIEITLARATGGTKLTLTHANVPDGHDGYRSGWKTHYFAPMRKYFALANNTGKKRAKKV